MLNPTDAPTVHDTQDFLQGRDQRWAEGPRQVTTDLTVVASWLTRVRIMRQGTEAVRKVMGLKENMREGCHSGKLSSRASHQVIRIRWQNAAAVPLCMWDHSGPWTPTGSQNWTILLTLEGRSEEAITAICCGASWHVMSWLEYESLYKISTW